MQVKARVESLLQQSPENRESDIRLLISYLWTYHNEFFTVDGMLDTRKWLSSGKPNPESITRARRLLRKKYPSSKLTEKHRRELEASMRLSMGEAIDIL